MILTRILHKAKEFPIITVLSVQLREVTEVDYNAFEFTSLFMYGEYKVGYAIKAFPMSIPVSYLCFSPCHNI
jgi:hypothetical protein